MQTPTISPRIARFVKPDPMHPVPGRLQEDVFQEAWSPQARAMAAAARTRKAEAADAMSQTAEAASKKANASGLAEDHAAAAIAHDRAFSGHNKAMWEAIGPNRDPSKPANPEAFQRELKATNYHSAKGEGHADKAEKMNPRKYRQSRDDNGHDWRTDANQESLDAIPPATSPLAHRIARFFGPNPMRHNVTPAALQEDTPAVAASRLQATVRRYTATTSLDDFREDDSGDSDIQDDWPPASHAALAATRKANGMVVTDPGFSGEHVMAAKLHMLALPEVASDEVRAAHLASKDAHLATANTARGTADAGSEQHHYAAAAHATAKAAWHTAGRGRFGFARDMADEHEGQERRHGRAAVGMAGDGDAQESLDSMPADAPLSRRLQRFAM